ncbi:TraY domain-containing protein [Pseudomonas cichorii]|uniref:TraY domain-containing protein n=1 Tax=Pseudomonas cichorii TaxID=36746 RepID=UPI001C8AA6C8|nr:TraY domain-containing protein [Pseudomonas cichorii]MBX8528568.1 TraY domain-containing protein [Pseudomonas cichorii]
MSKEELQVNFRMPASLKGELEALAKRSRRSLTAEIVARLERSVGETDEMGISDRDRLDPNHFLYTPEPPEQQITTRIHRDRLITGLDGPLTAQEEKIMSAMLKALRGIGKFEEDAENPNTGPKPRKRYPKE